MSKILLYDLETSPLTTYSWGIYEQNALEVVEDWQILCFAYKWHGEKKTHVIGQDDFKDYAPGKLNDKNVCKALWELMNEADVVVGHNSAKFDDKKSNARFIQHNLKPPEPFKNYDTLKIARKYFGFTSNKLDDLGQYLKVGKKLETGGFATWKGCMDGNPKAWRKMKKYNVQDVILLEKIYNALKVWDTSHPALNIFTDPTTCPRGCGGKMNKGTKYKATNTNMYQYYRCNKCGAMAKSRIPEKIEKPLYN